MCCSALQTFNPEDCEYNRPGPEMFCGTPQYSGVKLWTARLYLQSEGGLLVPLCNSLHSSLWDSSFFRREDMRIELDGTDFSGQLPVPPFSI